ncbi:MAG: hypothetical protein MK135_08275 [Polyangiaceae bacterium]|nr:hypothetical protein [Polyangiaceae bacterium]
MKVQFFQPSLVIKGPEKSTVEDFRSSLSQSHAPWIDGRIARASETKARLRLHRFLLLPSLGLTVLSSGCSQPKSAETADIRAYRDTEIVLENCSIESEEAIALDANADGRPEVVRVMDGDRELCRVVDLNLDGKVDRTTFFDDLGKVRRVESDFDRDGRIDEVALFKSGIIQSRFRATTMDGNFDTWECYERGVLKETERDENGDGAIDQWWEHPVQGCPIIHVDADRDGRPDPGESIDYCEETGFVPPVDPNVAAAKKDAEAEKRAQEENPKPESSAAPAQEDVSSSLPPLEGASE